MVDVKKVVLVVVSVGAFIFIAASNGGNNWVEDDRRSITLSYGLWNVCGGSVCVAYGFDSVVGKLHATRAFTSIGTLLCAAAAVVAMVRLCKEVDGKVVAGLFIVAGVCMIIALAIYTDYSSDTVRMDKVSYGWSYVLGWIATVMAFVAGALHIFLN